MFTTGQKQLSDLTSDSAVAAVSLCRRQRKSGFAILFVHHDMPLPCQSQFPPNRVALCLSGRRISDTAIRRGISCYPGSSDTTASFSSWPLAGYQSCSVRAAQQHYRLDLRKTLLRRVCRILRLWLLLRTDGYSLLNKADSSVLSRTELCCRHRS